MLFTLVQIGVAVVYESRAIVTEAVVGRKPFRNENVVL